MMTLFYHLSGLNIIDANWNTDPFLHLQCQILMRFDANVKFSYVFRSTLSHLEHLDNVLS